MPVCTRCAVDKPQDQFRPPHAQCRACERATESERYAAKVESMDAARVKAVTAGGEALAAFGLALERQVADSVTRLASVVKAAEELNIPPTRVRALLSELQRRAARSGWSPAHKMVHTVPEGFHVKGVSTLYDAQGEVRGQWVKSNKDEEHKLAAFLDAMSHFADAWTSSMDPVAAPTLCADDLMCIYPMGDPHIGMFAWGEETGQDFDLKIAEHNLCSAVDQLVASAPSAKRALLLNLGDYFHGDNTQNRTMRSGHTLDIDTRWPKVLRVGLRAFRRNIDRALQKHEIVDVWCLIGNHDDCSSVMLALALEQAYEREPRVRINTSPAKHQFTRHGRVMIASTHSDTCKMSEFPAIMAADRAEDWGATIYRYGYTGHVHHDSAIERPGCKVESFRTLAPRDAFHAASQYRSGQDMKCIVLHSKYGEISRNTVGINRLGVPRE